MQVPIFPLSESILYPGVYVPLHVYEEQYKTMLKYIEESGREMAISYSPEMQPGNFYPSMICGVGPVRIVKRYPNGETDILVFGNKRVKFNKYVQEVPFLIGEGEVIQLNREMPKSTEADLLKDIKEMLINWIFTNFDEGARAITFFKAAGDLEPICNFVAYYFLSDFEKKQKLLEENSLEAKAQSIWQVLKDLEDSGEKGPASNVIVFPGAGDTGNKVN